MSPAIASISLAPLRPRVELYMMGFRQHETETRAGGPEQGRDIPLTLFSADLFTEIGQQKGSA